MWLWPSLLLQMSLLCRNGIVTVNYLFLMDWAPLTNTEWSILVILMFFFSLVEVFKETLCFWLRDFRQGLSGSKPRHWPFDHFLYTWVLSRKRRHGCPVHLQRSAHFWWRGGGPLSDLLYYLWVTKSSCTDHSAVAVCRWAVAKVTAVQNGKK